MSRLSGCAVGLSSDRWVRELFIDCKSRCPVCLAIRSVYRLTVGLENYLSTVRVGVPSVWLVHSVCRLTVGLEKTIESVYRLAIGWENYLSTVRVGVTSELFIDCKSRCPVCLAVRSVYRPTVGWESYLSIVRVGVPSVILFSRCIVRLSGGRIIYRL